MMGYWYGPGMMGGGIFMMFGSLLIIGLIIYLLFSKNKVNFTSFENQSINIQNKALDVLKERYAKGEISTEEFQERKKLLE